MAAAFPEVSKVQYEGPNSKNPLAFRWYDADRVVAGRAMRDAVAAESAIDTRVVNDPLGAVIRGAWTMLPLAATLDLWKTWGGHQPLGGQRSGSRLVPLE